jgi:hypothetical protein
VVGSNALCATGSRLEFKNPSKPLPQIWAPDDNSSLSPFWYRR